MQHSRMITFAAASSRKSTEWLTQQMPWSEFVARLSKPIITEESLEEYLNFPKAKQDEIKDVGGFVGGSLDGTQRRKDAVTSRSIVTLDLDNLAQGEDKEVLKKLDACGCAYAVYSTRKHQATKPRLRVLIPLWTDASVEEYEPIARKLASILGIRFCDPTTFEIARLMYWPSHSKDSPYVFAFADKPLVDGKGLLRMYEDWRDVSSWPEVPGAAKLHQHMMKKQGDPLLKEGMVGAFCRRYNIWDAIDTFLPGVYERIEGTDRLTFVGGSTAGGAVVYDDKFLYSHHATDPCSQKLVNAFDLVRLHKFGVKDEDITPGTPVNKFPSYTAITEFIGKHTPVNADLLKERKAKMLEEFSVVPVEEYSAEEVLEGKVVEEDDSWMEKLECKDTGFPYPTVPNIRLILQNDKQIRDRIYYEEFSNRLLVDTPVPWDAQSKETRMWTDTDDSGLREFFEKFYKLTGGNKIMDGMNLVSADNKVNAVGTYLQSLTWDGNPRVETLFIDYLGCEDNSYTREAAKLSLIAAVRRAIIGGIKWDYMPIFIGPQGKGKSTFLKLLGKDWFNDSLSSFEGKEACEVIQGSWIVEVGELTGLRKSEVNIAKQFLSRQDDIFREAYGRRTKKYPRRCVFFGTSNDYDFLRDDSGNRRFWPIDTFLKTPKKSVFTELIQEVDQIWAEACELANREEIELVLSAEAESIASIEQDSHREENIKKGIIEDYLKKEIPDNWDKMDLGSRRLFLEDYTNQKAIREGLTRRNKVCIAEIWEEALGNPLRHMKTYDSREISSIMKGIKGWEKLKSTSRFGTYGIQKGYRRID